MKRGCGYHSVQKGIASIGTTRGGVKSGKGDPLIVVDAITDDGPCGVMIQR